MVNPGPLKICELFLAPGVYLHNKYPPNLVEELIKAMESFVKICGFAIKLNKGIIDETHRQFQQMVTNFYEALQQKVKDHIITLRQEQMQLAEASKNSTSSHCPSAEIGLLF
eukprot:TRINITY_DN11502_c0_g1_i1.p1 TRINITY_DN11502_c0_g1~~TRINITY_DN11502_c0_g1_i1.p1  ORF type:complete len:112 (-),score=19.49 TRINITY_DN11502_c0_g1_i1:182-517(-)